MLDALKFSIKVVFDEFYQVKIGSFSPMNSNQNELFFLFKSRYLLILYFFN